MPFTTNSNFGVIVKLLISSSSWFACKIIVWLEIELVIGDILPFSNLRLTSAVNSVFLTSSIEIGIPYSSVISSPPISVISDAVYSKLSCKDLFNSMPI